MLDTPVVAPPAPARGQVRPRDRGLILLALPSLVWYLIFTIGPLVAMFVVAFMDWEGLAAPASFNGLDNFEKLIGDERVYTALRNTAVHLFVSLPVIMVGSFMLGYFLNLKLPGHRLLRVIMFIPALISLSALGMLFVAVLGPTGLINSALDQIGLGSRATAWLADPTWAMPSLIAVTIWSGLGFTRSCSPPACPRSTTRSTPPPSWTAPTTGRRCGRSRTRSPATTSACSRCCSTCGRCSAPRAWCCC
jgi:multiple sugar transport system permease protein